MGYLPPTTLKTFVLNLVMSLDELERKKLEVLLNLCLGAGWVCWGAWSCDKQEAAPPPVAGLRRCGQRTGWWTSTSRRSGWAPGTSCSILLASYSLLSLREEKCTERRSVVTNGARYRSETAAAGCPNNINVVKTKKTKQTKVIYKHEVENFGCNMYSLCQ